ncbi:MAG: L,D-transpeptidase family protein [Coriobacteriia bacterium]|nr:L,D-transpeptidase family protein [Coriobacteriia bacterium]
MKLTAQRLAIVFLCCVLAAAMIPALPAIGDEAPGNGEASTLPLSSTWQYSEGSWCYFDDLGNLVESRWLFAGGYWYYCGADGKLLTSTIAQIGSATYAFSSAGAVIAGWYETADSSQLSSVSANSTDLASSTDLANSTDLASSTDAAALSWQLINGRWYYFTLEQRLLPNFNPMPGISLAQDAQNIKGVIYELGGPEGGVMKTGWSWENGAWYFRDLESGRILACDWIELNGNRYYLDDDGKRLASTITHIGSSTYAFNDEGAMITGWHRSAEDALLFFDYTGAAVLGWQYIGVEKYYFASEQNPKPDSRLSPGIYMAYDRQQIDGAFYLLGEPNNGSMRTGWQPYGDSLNYYFADGSMATGDTIYAPSPGNLSYSNFASDGEWLGYTTSGVHNPAWGLTYIEVDLTHQYLWFFLGGVCVLECEVVTGNPNMGWTTPAGTFSIIGMSRNVTMTGADYSVFCNYWMPFTAAGHGLHDASWQPSFGGNAYTYRGSHGCVNMPPWAAASLFSMVGPGTRVVIHY